MARDKLSSSIVVFLHYWKPHFLLTVHIHKLLAILFGCCQGLSFSQTLWSIAFGKAEAKAEWYG